MVTVLYFSVRVQKEGMNVETLMNESEMDGDGPGSYTHRVADGETV